MIRKLRRSRLLPVVILFLIVRALWSALDTSLSGGQEEAGEENGAIARRLVRLTSYQTKGLDLLGGIVQARLRILQNPKSCETTRLVVCKKYKACGLGCQLHHVTYCLLVAYATNRTLVWQGSGEPYTLHSWWGEEFLPLSDSCSIFRFGDEQVLPWSASQEVEQARVISLSNAASMQPTPKYLPPAIPADLAPELLQHHGAPSVWWVGQFVSFLLRLSPEMLYLEQELKHFLNFSSPVVGIHVRRMDRLADEIQARVYDLGEYMNRVENFYKGTDFSGKARKVFLASDDPIVIHETSLRFPNFTFLTVSDNTDTQYSQEGLVRAILILRLLSQTDHLVCTFRSNMCQAAYELMQAVSRDKDAGKRVTSVDYGAYYFHGQQRKVVVAIEDNYPDMPNDLSFSEGDRLIMLDEHTGFNSRTNQSGFVFKWKVRLEIPNASMPIYSVT